MADDDFVIENGATLRGYPRREESPEAFKWPSEDVRWVEGELFKAHAHFLLENRERIFADNRMFLAPVNVMSGAAYVGALPKPCVGTYHRMVAAARQGRAGVPCERKSALGRERQQVHRQGRELGAAPSVDVLGHHAGV